MDVSKQIIELNNLVGLDNFLNTINTHKPKLENKCIQSNQVVPKQKAKPRLIRHPSGVL